MIELDIDVINVCYILLMGNVREVLFFVRNKTLIALNCTRIDFHRLDPPPLFLKLGPPLHTLYTYNPLPPAYHTHTNKI